MGGPKPVVLAYWIDPKQKHLVTGVLAAPDGGAAYVLAYRGEPVSLRTLSIAIGQGFKYARVTPTQKGHIEVLARRCIGVLVLRGGTPLEPEPQCAGNHKWKQRNCCPSGLASIVCLAGEPSAVVVPARPTVA